LKKAEMLEENMPWVYFYLGQAYLGKQDNTAAIGAFNKAITLESNNPLFYYWRGNAHFASADYNSPNDLDFHSAQDYQMAVEFGLNTASCYFMYGNTLLNRGFYYLKTEREQEAFDYFETAIVKYKKVIELDPTASNAYNNIGLAYYYLDRLNEAISAYKKAIDLEPVVVFFHDNLGDAYYKKAQFKKALSEWSLVAELDPDYVSNGGYFPLPQKSIKEKIREAKRRYKE
jgi:tetratricopeptide (TPR) repeat protein